MERQGKGSAFMAEVVKHYTIEPGADLRGADLSKLDLTGLDFSGADLRGANLNQADLSEADLRADLRGANLSYANLVGVNLCGAYLEGANLAGAGFSMLPDLEGARADQHTVWPSGPTFMRFNPEEHGVVFNHSSRWRQFFS